MSYESWLPGCAICKEAVNLTESKTDERGQAVHEDCYVSMLVSPKELVAHGFELAIGSFLSGDASLHATS
jgi:hypothetical protein